MDIENLGESVIQQLVDRKMVSKVSDLYELTMEQLLSLEGFAEKSARNLIDSIEKSKKSRIMETNLWFRDQACWFSGRQRLGQKF